MMTDITKGYKCNHCALGFFEDENEAIDHAKECKFNPENKRCVTCKNIGDAGYDYSIPYCEKRVANFDDVQDGDLPCNQWESNDQDES